MQHDVASTPAAWMLDTRGTRADPRGAAACCSSPIRCIRRMIRGSQRSGNGRRRRKLRPRRALDPGPSHYRRLAFTAEEAAQILAEFPPAEVDQLVGLNATRERLLSLDWSKYRFIHTPRTHRGCAGPQLSALILARTDASGNVVDGAVPGGRPVAPDTQADVACSARATPPSQASAQRGPGRHQPQPCLPRGARRGGGLSLPSQMRLALDS